MDKKGVEITLNTVIVGILVVLVLLVVTTFFLGGTAGLTRTVRDIFYGTTAGTSEVIAVQTCNTRCDQARLLPTDEAKKNSAFCKAGFDIDRDNDGEVKDPENPSSDTKEIDVSCIYLGVTCEDIDKLC